MEKILSFLCSGLEVLLTFGIIKLVISVLSS